MGLKGVHGIGSSGGLLFALALALGVGFGGSLDPITWPAGESTLSAGVKMLGWLVVAALSLCVGAMAMLAFGPALAKPLPGVEVEDGAGMPEPIPQPAPAMAPSLAVSAPAPFTQKDPFLAALDYLDHAQATVRIGGILALERAAGRDDALIVCAGTLTAYVQQWAGQDAKPGARPGFDVLAALAVLSRLLPPGGVERDLVDLRRTQLSGLELPGADFSRFHLENAALCGADLRGCNLSGVNFRGADLRGALLAGAVFTGASLRAADLTGAILSDDEFGPADLAMAGNLAAAQLLHVRYQPNRPPRLPAGLHAPLQNAAVAV